MSWHRNAARRALALLACWLLAAAAAVQPAWSVAAGPGDGGGGPWYLHAKPEDMQWWLDAKFGMFIHWGPISLLGKEISWSRYERAGRGHGSVPAQVYDSLYKRFNPSKFDADEWVRIAREAGCKYIVFTTKHHDGFCMFDTATTDYKITNSPFGRDVTGELADACHRAGMRLGFYYSPPDWHHPDYRGPNHARYVEYMRRQIRELMTNYGRVDILWFDGLGGRAETWQSHKLFEMVRTLQPHIIINNRCGLPGDFDTPEQRIGHFNLQRPWESCITLGTQWAWKPNDRIKSRDDCIRILASCAGGGGNLLLNVGPMPTGEIEPRQAQRLREIGRWLKPRAEAFYGTRGGPFRPSRWYTATNRGATVYIHVIGKPPDEGLVLPPINRRLVSVATLESARPVRFRQSDEKITIALSAERWQAPDTILVLKFDRTVADAEVGKLASGSLAAGKPARASNVFRNMTGIYGPDKALDDDPATRWATDAGVHQAWLEVDLGRPVVIGRAFISEAYGRVRRFELQRWHQGRWVTFLRGRRLGQAAELAFEPVTTSRVRLNILEATNGPTIWEFQLFPPQ